MKNIPNTELSIEDLVAVVCGAEATAREKHVCRESLRGLVRLAKSEQMLEIRTSADRLTGTYAARVARRRAKALILAHRRGVGPGQTQLEFNQS
jgi:hypothetical protein